MSASESRFSTPVRETASARKVGDQTDESISVSDSAYNYRLLEISGLLTAFQPPYMNVRILELNEDRQ